MINIITIGYLISFLLGLLTGAAGKYLADKYTDKRRDIEDEKSEIKKFKSVRKKMTSLIDEMKEDLLKHELFRDFFIIPSRGMSLNATECFVYYEKEHDNLISKISILENNDYIYDISTGNTPKYRMTDEFVNMILNIR